MSLSRPPGTSSSDVPPLSYWIDPEEGRRTVVIPQTRRAVPKLNRESLVYSPGKSNPQKDIGVIGSIPGYRGLHPTDIGDKI